MLAFRFIEESREYVLRSNTSSENRKSRVPYNRDSFLLILRATFEPMIIDYEININNSQLLVIQVFRIKIIIVSQESVGKNKSCKYKGHTMVGLWTDDTSVLGKIVYEV